MLEIDELTGGYFAGNPVLHGIRLRGAPGQLVSVLGANGAGKSSLLGAVFGFLPQVSGSIRLDGKPLAGLGTHQVARAGVRMVPENRGTLPSLTVLENLQLGGMGLPPEEVATRVEAELARFPRLRERLRQRAGMLSGGEQQMLAIGRALMARPRLLLLDEPSQGLAPVIVEQIFELLGTLRGSDMTILLVEQDVGLSLEISDYAYVLEKGRVTREGGAAKLLGDPMVREAFLGVA
ncbi:ABC transporter ATP-binding protein [Pseudorhodoferax sp.]|uniref:ABC transporter ATP-binding protein n=1 Tax=Pseudorhodoferax sp. TaxID=1993553 RepID=UPI002DD6313D|nr:ABC transporter ATP-binding protein [Pseudorhodoferax sp.]